MTHVRYGRALADLLYTHWQRVNLSPGAKLTNRASVSHTPGLHRTYFQSHSIVCIEQPDLPFPALNHNSSVELEVLTGIQDIIHHWACAVRKHHPYLPDMAPWFRSIADTVTWNHLWYKKWKKAYHTDMWPWIRNQYGMFKTIQRGAWEEIMPLIMCTKIYFFTNLIILFRVFAC